MIIQGKKKREWKKSGNVADAVTKNQDEYTERWEDMEVQAGRNGFNDLFSHIRMIYAREKAKKAILDEFKSHVLAKYSPSEKLIEEVLEPYHRSIHGS